MRRRAPALAPRFDFIRIAEARRLVRYRYLSHNLLAPLVTSSLGFLRCVELHTAALLNSVRHSRVFG